MNALPERIYLIPGMTRDYPVYSRLAPLLDNVWPLPFIEPESSESLSNYAKRMADGLDANSFVCGVSFGGVVAQAISRILRPKGCIVIASVRHPRELPPWVRCWRLVGGKSSDPVLRLAGRLAALIPAPVRTRRSIRIAKLAGKTGEWHRWAACSIIDWDVGGELSGVPVIHIHGSADSTLPLRYVSPDVVIDSGRHALPVSHPNEVANGFVTSSDQRENVLVHVMLRPSLDVVQRVGYLGVSPEQDPNMSNNVFKSIPSVNELLETPALKNLVEKVSHHAVVGEVRSFLDELRREVTTRTDGIEVPLPSTSEIAETIAGWISKSEQPKLHPVINATGILLHTGLGRAPMAREAVEAVAVIGANYASLEIDPETGHRSQRIQSVENLLCELTGAEAAAVVNNNAGATMLTLAALAPAKEVIVSRGELIEIGGSYRLPDVMATGGSILREVGTTNKTRASDFENACGEETAALMRVHTSNYRVVGFTSAPTLDELVDVSRRKNIVMIDDIGSGALVDFSKYGVSEEPVARDSIAAGADVVLFSGDKLLGGPQCGIVVGKRALVDKIIGHPLMRALRVDKMTLAALTATLQLHRDPSKAESSIPLLQLLATSPENLKGRAERLAPQIGALANVANAEAVEDRAQLGGGSVPAQDIPTWCIAIDPRGISVTQFAKRLRTGTPSIFGRVQNDRLLLDLRTVFPSQETELVSAIQSLQGSADS